MRIALLIASRNRPDLVHSLVTSLEERVRVPHDTIVAECGTDPAKLSPHSTVWYADPDFRGKCFGHNVALAHARLLGRHDYYWVLMNDLAFPQPGDAAAALLATMERNPRMAVLSPTELDGHYPASRPRPGGGFRKVTTCDYLGFMVRSAALDDAGFLSPEFRYCWGAIHELSCKLYRRGWFLAYSDDVSYRHLGGSTYGAKDTHTIPRAEYQRNAKRFAYDYFRTRYGDNWDEVFWRATAGHDIELNTYAEHKRFWATGFSAEELLQRGADASADLCEPAAPDAGGSVRLHLGAGTDRRPGWINVDANPATRPDVVSLAQSLPMFPDRSVDVIEACHLFEHFTYDQALQALREWHRVLKPGGQLFLEMPNFASCIEILGKHKDPAGFDLGMIGIFGWPPKIRTDGHYQTHKWGWTSESLGAELRKAGFGRVHVLPITQTWRPAARTGRDMRLCAVNAPILPAPSRQAGSSDALAAAAAPSGPVEGVPLPIPRSRD